MNSFWGFGFRYIALNKKRSLLNILSLAFAIILFTIAGTLIARWVYIRSMMISAFPLPVLLDDIVMAWRVPIFYRGLTFNPLRFFGLALIVPFIIYIIFKRTVAARADQLYLLRCHGATGKQIFKILAWEGFTVWGAASAGVALCVIIVRVLEVLFKVDKILSPVLPYFFAITAALVLTMLSLLIQTRKILKSPPAEATYLKTRVTVENAKEADDIHFTSAKTRFLLRLYNDGVIRTILYGFRVLREKLHDSYIDLRYSRKNLEGNEKTKQANLGAHDVYHTTYKAMDYIFRYVDIEESDVLVDVGCGKGRVINYWLSKKLKNKIYGLELDPEVASHTAEQFAKWKNVTIISGDAIANFPADATIAYFYNPFSTEKVQEFEQSLCERFENREMTVIYYRPMSEQVFHNGNWEIKQCDMFGDFNIKKDGRFNKFDGLSIIKKRMNGGDNEVRSDGNDIE